MILAIFTNDLLKKIGRSLDIEKSSKLFEVFDSVGDALIYIYKLCKEEFKEVSKESQHIDERELKKRILLYYKNIFESNFEPRSTEYKMASEQYKKMSQLIDNSSLEEFADILKKAYSEVLKDIKDKKVNVK